MKRADRTTKVNLQNVSLQDEEKVTAVRTLFDSMDEYQKQFINKDSYQTLVDLEKRISSLKKTEESAE